MPASALCLTSLKLAHCNNIKDYFKKKQEYTAARVTTTAAFTTSINIINNTNNDIGL